ncbi:MAG: serine/threonine protein kinase [Polyangiaceae bacterium]|nr:serine/threonine protein kinase [Polyangiaceae bacterium]
MLSNLAVDQVLCGRYRLRGVLGKGGMGVVFKAEDLSLKRLVALKLVQVRPDKQGPVDDEERHREERFVREASLNAQIAHRNVVTIYDYGRGQEGEASFCYIAMELLAGETLGERLRRQPGGLPVTEIATLAAQIARGLRAAHQRGLVHRDLKPDNVMLTPGEEEEEVARILDFGLAKDIVTPHDRSLTDAGTVMGTPEYMAPEQVQAIDVDARTDLYSLGVLLYESVTGAPPFRYASAFKTASAHVRERVPEMCIPDGKPAPSKELKEIIFKLLAKRPADRIQTADELVRLLRGIPESTAPGAKKVVESISLATESRYQTGRKLAQTPRSIVYEATHLELGRQVIVKVYRAIVPAEVARLKRELPSIALLRHPSNARIYDIGMTARGPEGLPFVVMERVRGVSLRSVIAKQGSLPWRQATDIIVGVLEGLAEAHAMGVLHRHLTPDHVLVPAAGARRETVKIIGYRIPEGELDGSEPRLVSLPDPTYVAPEILRGTPVSERFDLYAVAVMLHELVLGRPPTSEFLSPSLGADPTPRDDIPPSLADIIRRSVSLDPGERYSSAVEFASALHSVKAAVQQDSFTNELERDARVSSSQRRLRSTGQPTVWFLAGDPALRRAEVAEVILSLRTTMRVEEIAQDHRAPLAERILSEEEMPPWVVVFGGLQVILEDPLLAALAQMPEVSRVLISTHMNTELLDTAINFSGLDHHIQLPSTSTLISSAIERMAARAGAARRYYDDLRLMAQQNAPASGAPARVGSRA